MDLEARRPALSELIGSGHVRITVAPKTGWEPSQFGVSNRMPALLRGFLESAVTSASFALDAANACSLAVTQWKTCQLNCKSNLILRNHCILVSFLSSFAHRRGAFLEKESDY